VHCRKCSRSATASGGPSKTRTTKRADQARSSLPRLSAPPRLRCAPDSAAPVVPRHYYDGGISKTATNADLVFRSRSDDAAARPEHGRRAQCGRAGTIAVLPPVSTAAAHARHAPAMPPPSTPGPPLRQAPIATGDRHPAAAARSAAQTCSRAAAPARVLRGRAALATAVPGLATSSAAPAAASGHPDARSLAPS
jgi:hypothetical protein